MSMKRVRKPNAAPAAVADSIAAAGAAVALDAAAVAADVPAAAVVIVAAAAAVAADAAAVVVAAAATVAADADATKQSKQFYQRTRRTPGLLVLSSRTKPRARPLHHGATESLRKT